jgi:chromosome partitioning protein
MATVISLISTKGGVGKTVSAVHLSAYFAAFGPTLLVDGDATRSATLWAKPGKLPFKVVPERQLTMELTKHHYDFLIVDTEANPTEEDMGELAGGSHLVIVPTIPDGLCLHSVLQTADKLRRLSPSIPFRVLLTLVPPRPNRDGEEALEFLAARQLPVFRTGIRRLVAFQRAVMEGVTVEQVDRHNLGWQDYAQVGAEVSEIVGLRVPE